MEQNKDNIEFKEGMRVQVKITDDYQPMGTIKNIPHGGSVSYCFVDIDGAQMKGSSICSFDELTPVLDEKIQMEDGTMATLYDFSTLQDFFKEKFPDGITIEMPGSSLVDLKELDELKLSEDFHVLSNTEFWGKINNSCGHLEYADEGILHTEMRLQPEDYHLIMPEDVYAYMDDDIAVSDLEFTEKAATTFAHVHRNNIYDMQVEVTKGVESLRHLYIEGRPFAEVMKAVSATNVQNDEQLQQVLQLQNLHEHGLQGKPLSPAIAGLVLDTVEQKNLRYDDFNREQQYQMAAHILLDRAGIHVKPFFHNIEATFRNERAAREAVDTINRMAEDYRNRTGKPYSAFALSHENKIKFNLAMIDPEEQMQMLKIVRDNRECVSYSHQPAQDFRFTRRAHFMLEDGQVVSGWLNLENLHRGHEYSHVHGLVIGQQPGTADKMNLLTAENEISFPEGKKDILVIHRMTEQQMKKANSLQSIGFIEKDPEHIYITARTGTAVLTGQRLTPQDTALYHATKNRYGGELPSLVKYMLASVYYAGVIKQESARIEDIYKKRQVQQAEKHALLNRITGAELYGKAYNLHIRCAIDGKWREGRPLKGFSLEKSVILDSAKQIGKEFLQYRHHFHESIIKNMAAETFADVLEPQKWLQQQQQQQTRGLKR